MVTDGSGSEYLTNLFFATRTSFAIIKKDKFQESGGYIPMDQMSGYLRDNLNCMIDNFDVTGDDSSAYIRKQLLRGRALSDGLNNLAIENGTVYAFVPFGIERDKLYRFENGGIYSSDEELRKRTARPLQFC